VWVFVVCLGVLWHGVYLLIRGCEGGLGWEHMGDG